MVLQVTKVFNLSYLEVNDGNYTFRIKYNSPLTNVWLRDDYINKETTRVYQFKEPVGIVDEGDVIIADILPIEETEDGYLKVKLPSGDTHFIHRMVVFTYGDKFKNTNLERFEVDHVNGNKHRNIPENLEVVDKAVNLYRAYKKKYTNSKERFIEHLSAIKVEDMPFIIEKLRKDDEI